VASLSGVSLFRNVLWVVILASVTSELPGAETPDWRNIRNGNILLDGGYADQPYIMKTDDGAWLAATTVGAGVEGASGEHVVAQRSTDLGKTWTRPLDIEPATGPEAAYSVLLKVPYGRIYVFYNYNADNVRQIIADKTVSKSGYVSRVDSQGHFVFKYSDDGGRTWSPKRYEVPQRSFEVDRNNPYGGKLKYFWNVGRAFTAAGAGFVPIHKVGRIGEGFFAVDEGALLKSDNILTEHDPERVRWQTLPDGDIGIRAPAGGGPVAEEHSISVLSDGSFFCVFRTIAGYSAFTYSRDGGHTWAPSQFMRYADGRLIKHPRAANFAWRCENGKFIYWFHNHGGKFIGEDPKRATVSYLDRNPAWLVGGVEVDSPKGKVLRWSQPEIGLYDDDPFIAMSYPDMVEDQGKYFITETQKNVARVHEIDKGLLEGMWRQVDPAASANHVVENGLAFTWDRDNAPASVDAPVLPLLQQRSKRADHGADDPRAGFSVDLWIKLAALTPGQILVDNRTVDGRGFALQLKEEGQVEIVLNDGRTENRWQSDPGMLSAGALHHIAATVDGGPKIISFVIDAKFSNGGDERQFGWGRFSPNFQSANGDAKLKIGAGVASLRIYTRALRTSEAIENYRAGLK
jgi:Concanavalin A-like lectin/glucanases superfamily/BNR repeat-like domain